MSPKLAPREMSKHHEALVSSLPILVEGPSCQKSIFRPTKFFSSKIFPKTMISTDLPPFLVGSKDSRKYDWCREGRVLLLLSMKQRQGLLARRRAPQARQLEGIIDISKLCTKDNELGLVLGTAFVITSS